MTFPKMSISDTTMPNLTSTSVVVDVDDIAGEALVGVTFPWSFRVTMVTVGGTFWGRNG